MRDPYNAFCTQPPIRIEGAPKGPLAGLTFAVKDLFDFAGHVTGAGNPDWQRTHEPARVTAVVVERLVSAGATALGKTHTDELSRGIFGENAHFGTPVNPRAPGRVPGGSSSGSAAAVAGELTDFALGTDTGGSVRVPASFCGIYGIRPTHGRLPLTGVVGQAPSFDTVGWFARDPNLLARVGAVLFGKEIAATLPNRLVIAEDAFAIADAATQKALELAVARLARIVGRSERRPLSSKPIGDWLRYQTAIQGHEAWSTFDDWIDRTNPRFGFEVADNFLRGTRVNAEFLEEARRFRAERQREFAERFGADTVICLPTTPFPAPVSGQPRSRMWELRVPVISLTCIAGMLGAPQLSMPLAELDGLPIGLSIVGPPGTDEILLSHARALVSAKVDPMTH
jgi:amidase